MPDVQGKLDEIITLVETAKGKALSGSACIIDRTVMLAALEDLRQLLPAEMSEARSLLRERGAVQDAAKAQADELVGRARAEAARLVDEARAERARLVSESELVDEAQRTASEITGQAEAESVRMRNQTDDYIDASLARFEQLLSASLETVARGRDRVAASRAEVEEYATDGFAVEGDYSEASDGPDQGELSWDSGEPLIQDPEAARAG